MGLILLVLLVLLVVGALPYWGRGGGYYAYGPSGLLFVLLIVVLILFLLGVVPY